MSYTIKEQQLQLKSLLVKLSFAGSLVENKINSQLILEMLLNLLGKMPVRINNKNNHSKMVMNGKPKTFGIRHLFR